MSAAEQKETFSETLAASLDTDCRFDVVQAVHENLRSRIEEHKEAKDPDALEITARDVVSVLRTSGVPPMSSFIDDFMFICLFYPFASPLFFLTEETPCQ